MAGRRTRPDGNGSPKPATNPQGPSRFSGLSAMTPALPGFEKLTDTRRRIHRAVDFIDENLDRDTSLAELAELACISRWHFQRVFTALVGRSPSDMARSLRLLRARDRIVFDGASVGEVAAEAGFVGIAAFTRAYRREFDRSPREVHMAPPSRPRPLRHFTIVERPPQMVTTLPYDGQRLALDPFTVDAQAYAGAGGQAWGALAVYHDHFLTPYDRRFRCDLSFRPIAALPEPAAPFLTTVMAGGLYACVVQQGLLFDLLPYWHEFATATLPGFGWRLRQGPVLRSFVSDRAVTPPSRRLAYLYAPVERLPRH